MATLTTKYSIGDVVWEATTTTERRQLPCPDCKGSRTWSATSPAGREYTFECPRCTSSHRSHREASLDYNMFIPATRRLTIGSVRADTVQNEPEYMCRETGIGSGSIYVESVLFPDESLARFGAQVMADLMNTQSPFITEQYTAALKVADYQLYDAVEHVWRIKYRALQYRIEDLLGTIEDCKSLSDARVAVHVFAKKGKLAT